MRQLAAALLLTLAAASAFAAGATVTLPYQGDNKWVAPAENAPLKKLMKAAREGVRHFTFSLPANERELNIARMEIVQSLLEREAKHGVVMEESASGHAAANSIRVSY